MISVARAILGLKIAGGGIATAAAVTLGVAFWPQVAMGQPVLTARARKQLAVATADLFLSFYES